MKATIFIDANILIAVMNKEYPLFTYAARVLSLSSFAYKLVTTNVCVAIAFYFAEKKHGTTSAKQKMNLLLQHIYIADCGEKELKLALGNKKVEDLEDGLQYYSALHHQCSCIVTENKKDFYFSEIPVFTSMEILKNIYHS